MVLYYKEIEWTEKQGALIANVPPSHIFTLIEEEKKELFSLSKAYFLRWNSQYDTKNSEFWYIVKDSFGDMEELSANTRSKLKRGLKRSYVKSIDPAKYKEELYDVYLSASKRYNTFEKIFNKQEFMQHIESLSVENYEFLGVFDLQSGKLVGYAQNLIQGNICFYEELFYHPDHLKDYIAYVLIFEMNRYYLEKKEFKYVHDGSRNLSHDTQIHTFLVEKFKFKKVYTHMEIAYRKDIQLLVSMLYPWKIFIEKCTMPLCKKLSVLLKHEYIRRSYD